MSKKDMGSFLWSHEGGAHGALALSRQALVEATISLASGSRRSESATDYSRPMDSASVTAWCLLPTFSFRIADCRW